VDAVYGREMSAHHYFCAFSYCDSGMIPWLLERGESLTELVGKRMRLFRVGGEINRRISDAQSVLLKTKPHFESQALAIYFTDGLSMEFPEWHFNLGGSNTEPLVRLNVETHASESLLRAKTAEVLRLIDG
jgi:phosphomannomutase